jgi:ACT domain-containing protein
LGFESITLTSCPFTKDSKIVMGAKLRRKRKKDLMEAVEEIDDLMDANKKYDDMIQSFSGEVRKLIQLFEYVVNDTIDKKTRDINLVILSLEVEKEKYKNELIKKFSQSISGFYRHLMEAILEEINSANKSRDSPETR